MGSVNRVTLVGNLGADPELRSTSNGKQVCGLRIATTETWKGNDGQRQEKTEWHRVNVWGPQAESCSKFLSKGRQVFIEGRLETRSWEQDGTKRYSTEITATNVVFLGGNGERKAAANNNNQSDDVPSSDDGDGQIPF